MNNLLNFFIEANLYLICFYLIYQLLLARDKHFRFNRAFLLTGIFLSLTLPFLTIDMFSGKEINRTFEGYIMLPAMTISSVQTESVNLILQWWQILGAIYFAGMIFYLTRLTWQMTHIFRYLPILNSSREKKAGYTLITTNGEIPTCSFFKFMFWDKSVDLSENEKKQILEHELAHIRQWHSIDVLLVEFLRTIFWFNPVIHLIKSRIAEVHEYLADFEATRKINVDHYSKLLTLQIFKSFDFALSNNFHKSQVMKRISMLKNNHSKSIWLNVLLLIPILSILIIILSCNVKTVQEIVPGAEMVFETTQESKIPSTTISTNTEQGSKNSTDGEIYTVVDDQPEPVGGLSEFYQYIQTNLKYPTEARNKGIEGKVFIEFVVDQNGKLVEVKTVKGIGYGCDQEAEKVIKASPSWKPGLVSGNSVNVRMIMPITFKLG